MKKQNFSCRDIFKVWSAHHENLEDIFFFEERTFNFWISELCPVDPKLVIFTSCRDTKKKKMINVWKNITLRGVSGI